MKFRIFIAEFQTVIKRMKAIKVENKSAQLISILSQTLAGKMNLARTQFFGMFIRALFKVQNVWITAVGQFQQYTPTERNTSY